MIGFGAEEGLYEFRGVGYERLGMLIYGSNRPDSVFPDVCMSVFEASSGGGEQGLDKFWLSQFAEESKGVSTDVLVRMLKVISYTITEKGYVLAESISRSRRAIIPHKDHLLL